MKVAVACLVRDDEVVAAAEERGVLPASSAWESFRCTPSPTFLGKEPFQGGRKILIA